MPLKPSQPLNKQPDIYIEITDYLEACLEAIRPSLKTSRARREQYHRQAVKLVDQNSGDPNLAWHSEWFLMADEQIPSTTWASELAEQHLKNEVRSIMVQISRKLCKQPCYGRQEETNSLLDRIHALLQYSP